MWLRCPSCARRIPSLALSVDANASYTRRDADVLAQLDEFGLLMIEQPLPMDDLQGHAELAQRLRTPVCLDESIESLEQARIALDAGACAIVNIKAGRVGGYLESRRIHDHCQGRQTPVWCGGMLETGVGRAANLALAALPNFTLPGDISSSSRYWTRDTLTRPLEAEDGLMTVPRRDGFGVDIDGEWLDEVTASTTAVPLSPGSRPH